jgi:hypothetical protein
MRRALSAGESLAHLHELIAEEKGQLASTLVPLEELRRVGEDGRGEAFGPVVAAGERARRDPGEYGLLVEAIFEGYLLHYWDPRLLRPDDADLRLLAGDFLYALGLSRLAALGDTPAVTELADLISLCARVHAGFGRTEASVSLAAGAWAVCALGVGAGSWPEGEEAKAHLRESPADGELVLAAAAGRAREVGIALEAERALIAFREVVSRDSGST